MAEAIQRKSGDGLERVPDGGLTGGRLTSKTGRRRVRKEDREARIGSTEVSRRKANPQCQNCNESE